MKEYVYRIHIRPESATIQNPFDFCTGKVRVNDKSGGFTNIAFVSIGF